MSKKGTIPFMYIEDGICKTLYYKLDKPLTAKQQEESYA